MQERARLVSAGAWRPGESFHAVFYAVRFPWEDNPATGTGSTLRPSDCEFIVPGTLEEAPEAAHEYWPWALERLRKEL
jgi:hypothetical protein